jgi:hypothetical protein
MKKSVFHSSSSAIISAENVAMEWNVVNNNDQTKRSIDAERINCFFVLRQAIWVSLKVSDFKDSSRVVLIPIRMSSLDSSLLPNLICSATLFAFWSQPRRILVSGCAQEKDCWLIADNKVIAHNAGEIIAFWYPINPIMMNAHR